VEILERVWWRLDRALDPGSIRVSARVGGLDALACGVTTVVDHHASPSAIPGSLALVGDELGALGLRSVLAYEITDRNGPDGARAGLEEHRAALAGTSATRAVLVGAHASFTLSDGTLFDAAALAAEHGTGLHIHVAEDRADVDDAVRRGFRDPVDRLARAGGSGIFTPSALEKIYACTQGVPRRINAWCDLALVAAFAGMENTRRAYAHAIRERYRFFSYGDAMLIERAA